MGEDKFLNARIEYDRFYPHPQENFYRIPYDDYQLEKFEKILKNQEIFNDKIKKLHTEISKLFEVIKPNNNFLDFWNSAKEQVNKKIMQIFAAELSNRPFLLKNPYINHPYTYEFIEGKNLGCEICGENRCADGCHIIPARFGGNATEENIILLCPTHHRLFDRGRLTLNEIKKIKFERKSKWAALYFWTANFPRHKLFNENLKKKNYRDTTFEDHLRDFIKIIYKEVKKRYKKTDTRKETLKIFCSSSYPIASKCYDLIKKGKPVKDINI